MAQTQQFKKGSTNNNTNGASTFGIFLIIKIEVMVAAMVITIVAMNIVEVKLGMWRWQGKF